MGCGQSSGNRRVPTLSRGSKGAVGTCGGICGNGGEPVNICGLLGHYQVCGEVWSPDLVCSKLSLICQ